MTWPTWDQLQSSSIVVLVASIIFALCIFVMDYIFGINVKFDGGNEVSGVWKGLLGIYYDIIGAYK